MKKWVVKEKYDPKINILLTLLKNRGIEKLEQEEFLQTPPLSHYLKALPEAFKESLKDARKEINLAIESGEPIIIHGDYDADGICASAILYKAITQTLKYSKVECFIPNRFDHGYGLSEESLKEVQKLVKDKFGEKGGLIITVDCGITVEEAVVKQAHKLGFKLIITDHHQKKESNPKAEVVLWNDSMVGAGVALILALVLGSKDLDLVSLAGIATVTDLAPLKGFNRMLVKKSLELLNSNPPLGILKLLEISGRNTGKVSVYDLGYIIGPRLNATGRLESALDSLHLLLEEDPKEVQKVAQKLSEMNSSRQELTQNMLDLAESLEVDQTDAKVIIKTSDAFHEGVVGLVAGKLVQKYYKPSIAVSISGDTAKGSARSVSGVNIIELLRHFEGRFTGLGGHPMAAGFSIDVKKLDKFISDFMKYVQEVIPNELLVPKLDIDLEIPLNLITTDLLTELDQLKPYGVGNPEPLFLSKDVGIGGTDFIGKDGAHMLVKLFDGQDTRKAIVFDAKNLGISGFEPGSKMDLAYTASSKEYNGKKYVDLIIKDF